MLCWASTASMAISYLNHDTIDRTLEIAQKNAKTNYASSNEPTLYGPDYYKYPSVFNKPGYLQDCSGYIDPSIHPSVHTRPSDLHPGVDYSCGYTQDELMQSIDKGYPIIVMISNGNGGNHSVILKGYIEDTNGVINTIYNDPLDGQEHMVSAISPLGYVAFCSYTPPVPVPDQEPANNTKEGADYLSSDQPIQGSIGQAGDVDFYKFGFGNTQNRQCILETTGTTDTYAEVYDSNGNLVASADNGGEGTNFKIQFTGSPYSNYYIKVSGTGTGSYTLSYTTN